MAAIGVGEFKENEPCSRVGDATFGLECLWLSLIGELKRTEKKHSQTSYKRDRAGGRLDIFTFLLPFDWNAPMNELCLRKANIRGMHHHQKQSSQGNCVPTFADHFV